MQVHSYLLIMPFFYLSQSPIILLDEYNLTQDNCVAIAKALQNGTAILVSDGSYYKDEEAGGSAFILMPGKTNVNRIVGISWSPGTKVDQNPYRSKLVGIDGGLLILAILLKYFNIMEGGIKIALDGESALNQAKDVNNQLNISQPYFDPLLDIYNHINVLPEKFNIKLRWVESHQKKKEKKKWIGTQNRMTKQMNM